MGQQHVGGHDKIVIFIDQQKFTLEDREYTPRELLTLAGENPDETRLKRKNGHDLEELADLDKPFEIKNGTRFVVFHDGPTPVS